MVKKRRYLLIFWCALILFSGVLMKRNIFMVSDLERIAFNNSKGYVENGWLARVGYNKFSFYANRYLDNFFAGTDPNYFFFGGHPREVPGGNNQMKISYWLLPFFLLGAYELLVNNEAKVVSLYGLTLFFVSWFAIDTLWWLLVPFWYLVVIYPLRGLWKK